MKIEPQENIVYIKTEEVKAGALDTSIRESAIEVAEVIAIGDGVTTLKPGDKIMVKAWAVDTVNFQGENYRFVNINTGGILCKVIATT